MTPFYFCGVAFACWAVLLALLGITRERFPATQGAQRAVAAISILLAAAAIGTAIYGGIHESKDEGGSEGQALVPRI